ncbi:LLM class flavin-dependent oxidoreductase [Salinibacterium sp. dk2585]|uniref:LLM class flavin-dependent oxidoreductase n=1 Tax=unclassified Salinibacterium TaxID=2632331 RepID=UPI0011C24C95|nr:MULTISPECIES: LLM class flavin-dependent oxidoreductase [unclassified Salinibacterium]QEE60578.1 LLM class flavin-dependent oxidoreductase [Salinibacterium sp. dk2585]TXK55650.1 LLM class flavin-dependent oxidoreductase [Salinibacterium sp. dk5596]
MVSYGVFLPVGNNGWILSESSPQYMPSYELNREIVQRAEKYDFGFALAMLKYRGFGGTTQHWDHTIDPFTLMAALAPVTERIKLYATISPLTYHPVVAAKMAAMVDDVSGGRFGLNLVAGWNRSEYAQMGAWPGDDYYGYRYDYLSEFTHILKESWAEGRVTFKGEHFAVEDCEVLPKPKGRIDIISAGASPRGRRFIAEYADFHFGAGSTPEQVEESHSALMRESAGTGRNPQSFASSMLIIGDTDADAARKVELYAKGADAGALEGMYREYSNDTSTEGSSAAIAEKVAQAKNNPFYGGGAPVVGSPQTIANHLNRLAAVSGTAGIMLTFDDFIEGIERFGAEVMPLLDHVDVAIAA